MNKYYKILLIKTIALLFLFTACDQDDEWIDNEEELLAEFLQTNNIDTEPTESGLYFIKKRTGIGNEAEDGAKATIIYTARLVDGRIFDSATRENPFQFTIGSSEVIAGINEGVEMMREGDNAMLIIPSELAYGDRQAGTIPPYSTLIFDIILIEIQE